jgi:hypothetical protein
MQRAGQASSVQGIIDLHVILEGCGALQEHMILCTTRIMSVR